MKKGKILTLLLLPVCAVFYCFVQRNKRESEAAAMKKEIADE